MNDTLKVGVIGVGSLGRNHARIYAELSSAELVGIFDTNPELAKEVAQTYNTRPFDDLDALAKEIDAASVVVPTDVHHAVYTQLAKYDLHMLVEKPIAADMPEAESMVNIAHERNLILQVGHVERFNPVMQFIEDELEHPRFIEVTRLASYPPPRPDSLPRGTEVSVVLDLMIHDLDIVLHIVNSPIREIHAVGIPVLSASEDIANARISFENGCVANVTASRVSQERMRKIRIFEEDVYVSLDYMDQSGQLLKKTPQGIVPTEIPIEKGEPLAAELAAFAECVKHRNDPLVSGRHGSEALNLAIEVCRHIRQCPS